MKNLLGKVCLAIVAAAAAAALIWRVLPADAPAPVEQKPLGATIPTVVSLFETSLQGKITAADTSMTLVSGSDRNSTALSGYMCFTIDEGSASVEFVCGTASSTSVTGMTRGIDPLTGTTAVTALKKAHNRGAAVKITNYPQLAIVSRVLNGTDTLPNPLQYASVSTTTLASNTAYLASVQYVNGVALQGAPTATTTLPGVVQIATTAQMAAGTGMTGQYTLVPAASLFNQTPSSATTVPVTSASGKLAQGFLDLTQAFTFTGVQVHTATTTLATTTITSLSVSGSISVPAPVNATDAVTKTYADTKLGGVSGTSTWLTGLTSGTAYLATSTAGTFMVSGLSGSGQNATLTLSIGNTSTTFTTILTVSTVSPSGQVPLTGTIVIPSGAYFKATITGTGATIPAAAFAPFN